MGFMGRDVRKPEGKATLGSPYTHLYVYLINGFVQDEDEYHLGDDFVGNWVEGDSSFLFFKSPAEKALGRLFKRCPKLELIEFHCFSYDQWQGGGLEPLEVSNFVIVPPWKQSETGDNCVQILLDPGVVFGNGLHPTTRDCLRALNYTWRQRPFTKVLDLGTGTGVLALAAAFLGAEHVLAVDINPLCVKTAEKNVKLNGLDEIIHVVRAPAEDFVNEIADLFVANIRHDVIKRMLDSGGFCYIDRLIISGLMRSQFRDVKSRLEGSPFQIIREWDHDMTWFTFLAKR